MSDAWVDCEDVLCATDDLLCARYSRHCADCQGRALTQTLWPVRLGGRLVGVVIGLCDRCLWDEGSPARVAVTLQRRYRACAV